MCTVCTDSGVDRERLSPPLKWHTVRPGDGDFVQVRQEFLEGIEERPVGEQADGFVGVHSFWNSVLLSDVFVFQSEGSQLEIGKRNFRIFLVERYCSSINLEKKKTVHNSAFRLKLQHNNK